MPALTLPPPLARLPVVAGRVAFRVMQDLTVYLAGPSEQELEWLVDLYEATAPPDAITRYRTTEIEAWSFVARPDLTASGRAAYRAGARRPWLEPVRHRIRDGRAFDALLWDGRPIDDPAGSWSFACRRILLRDTGLHAFVRFLVPLDADATLLLRAAQAIADTADFHSGHAGLTFAYDPWLVGPAFDRIYTRARRFWGIDVEHLRDTIPLMRSAIKGVAWLTLLGNALPGRPAVADALGRLPATGDVRVETHARGMLVMTGDAPVVGDVHHPGDWLEAYQAVARALAPLYLEEHADFPSERWVVAGDTVGWIRRFLEPDSWR